jgi:hypothetical protein
MAGGKGMENRLSDAILLDLFLIMGSVNCGSDAYRALPQGVPTIKARHATHRARDLQKDIDSVPITNLATMRLLCTRWGWWELHV